MEKVKCDNEGDSKKFSTNLVTIRNIWRDYYYSMNTK